MHSIFRPGHARSKRQRAANDFVMECRLGISWTANAGLRGNNAFRVASGFAQKSKSHHG